MNNTIGKKFTISGMTIEIVADASDRWEARNTTTHQTVFMKKDVLDNAIRLGKAEEVTASEDN